MDDKVLLKPLQKGDEEAFKKLVGLYQDKVYNTVLGFLQAPEDAEDIAQEVFIEIFNSVGKFKGEAKLSTWIYRIAVNKSLAFIRKQKRQKRFAFFTNIFDVSESKKLLVSDFEHPGVKMEHRENAKILFSAIGQLPENQKIAFTLHKVEGLSYQEVSQVMDLSVSSVESLMFRAKKKLRKMLADFYANYKGH